MSVQRGKAAKGNDLYGKSCQVALSADYDKRIIMAMGWAPWRSDTGIWGSGAGRRVTADACAEIIETTFWRCAEGVRRSGILVVLYRLGRGGGGLAPKCARTGPSLLLRRSSYNTRKYMHAETLALLTKPLCFPSMKYCHGNTIILRIVLKLKNPPKISLLITK